MIGQQFRHITRGTVNVMSVFEDAGIGLAVVKEWAAPRRCFIAEVSNLRDTEAPQFKRATLITNEDGIVVLSLEASPVGVLEHDEAINQRVFTV